MVDYVSGESIENNINGGEYYENALINTEGIFENNLGPSGSFVNSHSPPGQRYNLNHERRSSQLENFITDNTAEQDNTRNQDSPKRPNTMQLLRYEAANSAINPGMIPTSFGFAAVAED